MRVDALDGLRVAKVWLSTPPKNSSATAAEPKGGGSA
jgi:hypothetical protein